MNYSLTCGGILTIFIGTFLVNTFGISDACSSELTAKLVKSTLYGYGGTEAVLSAFRRRERFTNLELARFLEWEINTVIPRVNELVKKGVLEEHCKRQCEISGRTATCWQIKAVGQLGLL